MEGPGPRDQVRAEGPEEAAGSLGGGGEGAVREEKPGQRRLLRWWRFL